jgi:hypothetical protein
MYRNAVHAGDRFDLARNSLVEIGRQIAL